MSLRSEIKAFVTKVADVLRSHEYRLRELEVRSVENYDDVRLVENTLAYPVPDQKIYRPDGTLAMHIVHGWEHHQRPANIPLAVTPPMRLVSITRNIYGLDGQTVIRRVVVNYAHNRTPYFGAVSINLEVDKTKDSLQ